MQKAVAISRIWSYNYGVVEIDMMQTKTEQAIKAAYDAGVIAGKNIAITRINDDGSIDPTFEFTYQRYDERVKKKEAEIAEARAARTFSGRRKSNRIMANNRRNRK